MTIPIVTETIRVLQPVDHDTFIDDVSKPTPPGGWAASTRRRIFD